MFQVQGRDDINVDQSISQPTFNIHKRGKNEENGGIRSDIDMLSKLPDDILVYVLSFMDMKTAGRTSILSKRWRYVWTYIIDLDFKDPKMLKKKSRIESLRFWRYIRWVNRVTTSHRALNLNFMRIHFPLRRAKDNQDLTFMEYRLWENVDKWIEFGLSKKVPKLELNLATRTRPKKDWRMAIRPILTYSKTNFKSPHLKTLHLEALCIDGPLVEKVLSDCPNLEQLIVKSCTFKSYNFSSRISYFDYFTSRSCLSTRLNIRISVSSLTLKHLEFGGCNIEKLTIYAPKLTCFVLIPLSTTTTMPEVEYTGVPSLVDATFASSYYFDAFDFPLHQLEKFSLRWDQLCDCKLGFPNLCGDTIIIALIQACPWLHTLKLELHSKWWALTKEEYVEKAIGHERLKVIEIVGYDGSEFFDRLIRRLTYPLLTPKLTKIVIHPRSPQFMHKSKSSISSRVQAILLANQIEEAVDVVIL